MHDKRNSRIHCSASSQKQESEIEMRMKNLKTPRDLIRSFPSSTRIIIKKQRKNNFQRALELCDKSFSRFL
jgi:hypothetical protein